ncbi:MAG: hypothetical protein ACOX0A_02435 [Thermoguttaceae bacterium]|jgi:hypothetical protein
MLFSKISARWTCYRDKIRSVLEAVAFLSLVSILLVGCATPIFWTDNKVLLYLPGAGRRSDEIPGYLRPWERTKLIEEKGKKGARANPDEKDVLLVQLDEEYEKAESPYVKRAVIEAVARICADYSNPAAEKLFKTALESDDMNLNFSACNAWAQYCTRGAVAKENQKERRLAAELLANRYNELPYSIAAGSEDENDRCKDIRLAILRAFSSFEVDDSPLVLETLELGLIGEKLDDGALQNQACLSLGKVTGKKYGHDAEAWLEYLAYTRGELSEPPKEPFTYSKLPKLDNATGIFK